jgi:RNA polymerase sigma factor (sigma-70 family)
MEKITLTKENFVKETKKAEYFVKGKLFKYITDDDTINDMVQTTYLKAWENLHKFDNKYSTTAWLCKIATNLAIDHLRKNKHFTVSLFDENFKNSDSDGDNTIILESIKNNIKTPIEKLIDAETKIELNNLIRNNCSYAEKKLLMLFYKKDLKIKDCAIILNLNENTIKTKLRRTLFKLKNNTL